MSNSSTKIRIYEVGPRDGLQNEKELIATKQKVELVNLLSDTGFEKIEVTSFVSPKWVPQMADAIEVLSAINRNANVTYAALTPNMKGFEKAIEANVEEVAIFGSASETFSQKNINCSIKESLDRFLPVVKAGLAANVPVRAYVSCVAGCPYEGDISPDAVKLVAEQLLEMGCYEVSLGDTIGKGTPDLISKMLEAVLKTVPANQLAGHYHDTNGKALDNVQASLEYGVTTYDSAVGGLGGCPYAPGAKGNLSTKSLAEMLHAEGYITGLDMQKLQKAEDYLAQNIANKN
ncbi:hydroxymethylglutaryl-CoA lyase [Hyphomicrobiales bacterium 4NK60-0047b]|jgi:hydroxymethylglutaryl-CoA lyase